MITNMNTENKKSTSPINVVVRLKNPWFWFGIIGVVFTALNITPETASTWEDFFSAFKLAIQNPYTVISTIAAVIGVIIDPTTIGIGDSTRALSYTSPKK